MISLPLFSPHSRFNLTCILRSLSFSSHPPLLRSLPSFSIGVAKVGVFDYCFQNLFSLFHNFFFAVFVAISCKELRSNRAAKISSFHSLFQTFFHLFHLSFLLKISTYLICSWRTFVCKELVGNVLFCKAGRKDKRV
jgi:hypothetical protein